MNLAPYWDIAIREAREYGHDLAEIDDERGRAAFHCSNCDETFAFSVSDVYGFDGASSRFWFAVPRPCHGRPLYRPIPGTPWFDYSQSERTR